MNQIRFFILLCVIITTWVIPASGMDTVILLVNDHGSMKELRQKMETAIDPTTLFQEKLIFKKVNESDFSPASFSSSQEMFKAIVTKTHGQWVIFLSLEKEPSGHLISVSVYDTRNKKICLDTTEIINTGMDPDPVIKGLRSLLKKKIVIQEDLTDVDLYLPKTPEYNPSSWKKIETGNTGRGFIGIGIATTVLGSIALAQSTYGYFYNQKYGFKQDYLAFLPGGILTTAGFVMIFSGVHLYKKGKRPEPYQFDRPVAMISFDPCSSTAKFIYMMAY